MRKFLALKIVASDVDANVGILLGRLAVTMIDLLLDFRELTGDITLGCGRFGFDYSD